MCFTVGLSRIIQRFLAAIRPGETPVPIPNTTVKTRAADDTALETVWESRRPPDFKAVFVAWGNALGRACIFLYGLEAVSRHEGQRTGELRR